jgi:hypothetical protein
MTDFGFLVQQIAKLIQAFEQAVLRKAIERKFATGPVWEA